MIGSSRSAWPPGAFDGERVDTAIFGGPGRAPLSPLADFLPGWGLSDDVRARGANPVFALQVLNSRDDPGPFGQADVSQVIVGGNFDRTGAH